MTKTRVVFLHKPGHIQFGAKIMRCDQLADILNRFLGDTHTFEVAAPPHKRFAVRQRRFARALKGSVVILLKNAAQAFTPEALDVLRRHARGVCIDHVDAAISDEMLGFPDIHIAASRKGETQLNRRLRAAKTLRSGIRIAHLCHHADPRLVAAGTRPQAFEIGYFGNTLNTVLPVHYSDVIRIFSVSGPDAFPTVLPHIQNAGLHYGVRGHTARPAIRKRMAKPFTKGFNAAAVGSNIMVNRQVDDAEYYLGGDYPYLVDDLDDSTISAQIEFARDSFNGPDWNRGLKVMEDMRQRCAPAAVAQEMKEILAEFA